MGVPIEYWYEFYNDFNNLKLWFRFDEDSVSIISYMSYKKYVNTNKDVSILTL